MQVRQTCTIVTEKQVFCAEIPNLKALWCI